MFKRFYSGKLDALLRPGKVLALFGPRRTGKTTLAKEYLKTTRFRYRFERGEDLRVEEVLCSRSLRRIQEFVEGFELLVLDEAHRVPDVGLALKLLVDHVPGLRILATGSATFDLSGKLGEPLTGRKATRILYPLAQLELFLSRNPHDLRESLEDYLIYGSYPEVLTARSNAARKEQLGELVGSYLLKDVLELERVKQPRVLLDLLRLLAFQIGHDVSLSELASNLRVDYKTVARYLDLLEKSFVLISLSGFSRNLRKEISKSRRYYFLDNGIRNAVVANFNALDLRDDVGALWENFLVAERIKRNHYTQAFKNIYFWRTYDRKEIDLVEEGGGNLQAFEFKYGAGRAKAPREFLETYRGSSFEVVNRDNYLSFVGAAGRRGRRGSP
jgi:predicted AAA+ superfamily ATPase